MELLLSDTLPDEFEKLDVTARHELTTTECLLGWTDLDAEVAGPSRNHTCHNGAACERCDLAERNTTARAQRATLAAEENLEPLAGSVCSRCFCAHRGDC